MKSTEQIIVFVITIIAAGLTWKMVFDFYKRTLHRVFAHLIAVMTASFMLLSSTFLFMNQNYQRGGTEPEVLLTPTAVATVFIMVFVLFIFFRYIPSRKK